VMVFRRAGNDPAVAERRAYHQAEELLRSGDFDGARAVVAQAGTRGTFSDRLMALEAEAVRRIPAPLALVFAGRLTDFGFEIGGATARGASPGQSGASAEHALKVLSRTGSSDDAVALNRGHALLSLQRPREALAEFQTVVDRSPNSPLAWLGQGLARYALNDYPAAEEAFRTSLRRDPNVIAARINLAMTLAEEGRFDEALSSWEEILAHSSTLTAQDRRAIENEAAELRRAAQSKKE
jgi:tetratricopeptide (TPR) repeat protein